MNNSFYPSEHTLQKSLTLIPFALLQATQRLIDPSTTITSKQKESINHIVVCTKSFGIDLFVGRLQEETIHESCSWLDIGANKVLREEVTGLLVSLDCALYLFESLSLENV